MDFTLGKTSSGLALNFNLAIESITTSSDLFDALAAFEAFATRELQKNGRTDAFTEATDQISVFFRALNATGRLQTEMEARKLKSYADRVRYGARLLNREYQDR